MSLLAVSWHFCSGTHTYLALDSTLIHLITSNHPGQAIGGNHGKNIGNYYLEDIKIFHHPGSIGSTTLSEGEERWNGEFNIQWSFVIIFLLTNHANVDNINIPNGSTESVVIGQCQQGGYLMIASSHWSILFYSCDTGGTGGEGVIHLC